MRNQKFGGAAEVLIVFGLLALVLGATMLISLVSVFEPEDLPAFMRPLWIRLRQIYNTVNDKLNEATESARADFEAERQSGNPSSLAQLFMPPFNPDGPPVPLAVIAWQQAETAPKAAAKSAAPERDPDFFLLEVGTYCHFEPNVRSGVVHVNRRIYRRLVDYCAFAFDQPLTPEATFAHAGLGLRVIGRH